MIPPEYVFHRVEDQRELQRLRTIEQVFDSASRRRLSATGLQAGWSCLEVGPGAGSILRWLSEVVEPTGRVDAVDLSTKFLGGHILSNVTVHEGDIRTLPIPDSTFDLVHARYVLIHVPDVDVALSRMLAVVKPGGWLVLEEPDFSGARGVIGTTTQLAAVQRVNLAITVMYDQLKMDYQLGLKLPALLQQKGLTSLTVEHDAPLSPGRSGMATIMGMSALQLREKYLATGVVTEQDLDLYGRFADDPESWAIYYATVAVTAQKPR
ncbi:MAG: methyltransferase [Nitrospira sp. SG-bin1]|nr:MAG: methyltransferase [Nitrospira sp. SG-bin1]